MADIVSSGAGGDDGDGPGGQKPTDVFDRTKKDRRANHPSTSDDEATSDSSSVHEGGSLRPRPTIKREQRIKWNDENDSKLLLLGMGRYVPPKEFQTIADNFAEKPTKKAIQERVSKLRREHNALWEKINATKAEAKKAKKTRRGKRPRSPDEGEGTTAPGDRGPSQRSRVDTQQSVAEDRDRILDLADPGWRQHLPIPGADPATHRAHHTARARAWERVRDMAESEARQSRLASLIGGFSDETAMNAHAVQQARQQQRAREAVVHTAGAQGVDKEAAWRQSIMQQGADGTYEEGDKGEEGEEGGKGEDEEVA